jgi:hypothetical protein
MHPEETREISMKSVKQDGDEFWRKWHRTRQEHLARISGHFPRDLCAHELELTVCCRYAESLLRNQRVSRFLNRNHAPELRSLQNWLSRFAAKVSK